MAPLSTYLRTVPRAWLATLALVALYLVSGWADGAAGLVRTVVVNSPRQAPSDVRRVPTIDVAGLAAWTGGTAGGTVGWRGAWYVSTPALYDLVLSSQGRSSWTIDGHLANQVTTTGNATRTVWLDAGFHALDIWYAFVDTGPGILVAAARTGGRPEPLAPGTLSVKMPRHPRLLAWIRSLHAAVGWLALAALVWALRTMIGIRRGRWRGWFGRGSAELSGDGEGRAHRYAWLVRPLAWSALAVILAHGALLRLDAITGQYGPVSSPRWLAAVQTREFANPERIRPASIRWEREQPYPHRNGPPTLYRSDPYTYLDAARKMTSFYAAHWREPVFPFVTRVFLGLLHDQDVAVSFASAFCSILAIWFTYLLGAAAWRPVRPGFRPSNARAVVEHDHLEVRIILAQQRTDAIADVGLFVSGGRPDQQRRGRSGILKLSSRRSRRQLLRAINTRQPTNAATLKLIIRPEKSHGCLPAARRNPGGSRRSARLVQARIATVPAHTASSGSVAPAISRKPRSVSIAPITAQAETVNTL